MYVFIYICMLMNISVNVCIYTYIMIYLSKICVFEYIYIYIYIYSQEEHPNHFTYLLPEDDSEVRNTCRSKRNNIIKPNILAHLFILKYIHISVCVDMCEHACIYMYR